MDFTVFSYRNALRWVVLFFSQICCEVQEKNIGVDFPSTIKKIVFQLPLRSSVSSNVQVWTVRTEFLNMGSGAANLK